MKGVDRNKKTVCGIGCIGEGKYKPFSNNTLISLYHRWQDMIDRCVNNRKNYENCSIEDSWYNFQNYCKDIENILINRGETLDDIMFYEIDKDLLQLNLENKIYSKNTISIITREENNKIGNKRHRINKVNYFAINLESEIITFQNQSEFARMLNVTPNLISYAILNKSFILNEWRIFEEKYFKDNIKNYYYFIAEKGGQKIKFLNQRQFCIKNNLEAGKLSLCLNNKRRKHKGWIFKKEKYNYCIENGYIEVQR